jgi:hypothetical protein
MREPTRQCRLEEAFRQELFRLINQYVSFPKDAILGKIVCTLVSFQQVRAAVEELGQRTCVAVLPGVSAGQLNESCVSSRNTTGRTDRLVPTNLPEGLSRRPVLAVNNGRSRSPSDERQAPRIINQILPGTH